MRYLIIIFFAAYMAGHIEEATNLQQIFLALYIGGFYALGTYLFVTFIQRKIKKNGKKQQFKVQYNKPK